MFKGIFITGTDTNVGKTVITACLASELTKAGKNVCVYKPVQCGNLLKGKIKSPDLAFVKKISNIPDKALVNDYSFSLPASPHLSAKHEKKMLDIGLIKMHYHELTSHYDIILVEGAGGLIVPLNEEYTVLNLIQELRLPVIIVARAGLGTINHTSMTLTILKSYKIQIIGVILNYYKGGIIEEDNKKIIQKLNNTRVLGIVPYSKDINSLAEYFESIVKKISLEP